MPWPSSVQSTLALAGAVVCGLYVWTQLLRSSSRTRRPAAACAGTIEPHEVSEVSSKVKKFEAVAELVQCSMSFRIVCEAVADDAVAGPGQKIVHFVRHGEGVHNVAQREWRSAASWDGMSEPYTLVTDPQGRYIDAELTPRGKQQAAALQARTALLHPQLLVVSPMRRATQTALIAFEHHVARGNLPVLANELCHETAGKHTCDKRLSKTALSASFPNVNYDAVVDEEDPYWGDGQTRESCLSLAQRAGAFADWLCARREERIAVVAHSGFLCAMMVAVLGVREGAHGGELGYAWFGTGELRTIRLTISPISAS